MFKKNTYLNTWTQMKLTSTTKDFIKVFSNYLFFTLLADAHFDDDAKAFLFG